MKKVTGTVTQGGMETFRLSPDEKRQLLESIAQADRGELIDGEALLSELDESNCAAAGDGAVRAHLSETLARSS